MVVDCQSQIPHRQATATLHRLGLFFSGLLEDGLANTLWYNFVRVLHSVCAANFIFGALVQIVLDTAVSKVVNSYLKDF